MRVASVRTWQFRVRTAFTFASTASASGSVLSCPIHFREQCPHALRIAGASRRLGVLALAAFYDLSLLLSQRCKWLEPCCFDEPAGHWCDYW